MESRSDVDAIPAAELNAAQVRAELARVLASPSFARAPSHQRLLGHLVQRWLDGDLASLKESVLGIEVFRRPAGAFDPLRDSIVRVEARRLRQRLATHYRGDGANAPLRIDLPRGSYQPVVLRRRVDGKDARERAADLVQRGQFFLREGHEAGHRKALSRFEQAVRADAGSAEAHAGVARAWMQLVATNIEPPLPGVEHALQAAHRALALQPRQAEALVMCAQLEQRFRYDWRAAQALYRRALDAAPESAYVRHAHAFGLMMRRDFGSAEAELIVARRLDPLNLSLRAHQALLHLYRRELPAAVQSLESLLDLSPGNVLGMSLMAYAQWLAGDAGRALQQYREVQRLHPLHSIGLAGEALACVAQGRAGDADAALARLREQWRDRYLSPYQLAMVQCALLRADEAVALLQRAVDERDPNAICLPVDPCFDPLRADPRLRRLEDRVLDAGAPPAQG